MFIFIFAAVGILLGRFVRTANGECAEGVPRERTNKIVQIRYDHNGAGDLFTKELPEGNRIEIFKWSTDGWDCDENGSEIGGDR